jgi:hypothetical protein
MIAHRYFSWVFHFVAAWRGVMGAAQSEMFFCCFVRGPAAEILSMLGSVGRQPFFDS